MPGPSDLAYGNLKMSMLLNVTLSPSSVANATTAEQTFTVPGLAVGDFVGVIKPSNQAGLGLVNARVSAANTLALTFANTTAATITPTASEVYQVMVDRATNATVPNAIT